MIAPLPATPSNTHSDTIPMAKVINLAEHQLVSSLRSGEAVAFNQLYKMYAPTLLGVIFKMVNQQENAEDLLQEVFVKIRNNIITYDESKSRLFTWMLNISRHTAIDYMRLKSTRSQKLNVLMEDAGAELEPGGHQPNINAIGVTKLLEQLSPRNCQLLELSYYQGFSHHEISKLLEMPLDSVKTAIRQGVLQLRRIFDIELID